MLRVGGNELSGQQVFNTISGAETYLLFNLSTRKPEIPPAGIQLHIHTAINLNNLSADIA